MILYGGVAAAKDGGPIGSNGGGCVTPVVLKKGPWTAAEDEILAAYVREHGEGNWNAVQKNTGLARCGKSCRLRWANHLRPNLKKGAFTADEERLIIQLHAQLGNKWARMAAQLPGRTDNEIKNFWNTRLKRLQRQGLPLYPPDIIPTHQLKQQPQPQPQLHQQHNQQMYLQPSPQPEASSSPLLSPSPSTAAANATATGTARVTPFSPFTFQTTPSATAAPNTNNLFCTPRSPTPCPSPTTPQPPSPILSSTPPISPHQQFVTLPLFASPRYCSSYINNNNNNNAFSFPRPPPLLKQPSLRFKRCFNGDSRTTAPSNIVPSVNSLDNTSNGGGVFATPAFSPSAKRSSYAAFLTLPYSSPATPTGASSFHNNNNPPTSTFFSLNPSSNFPITSSSPNLTQIQTRFPSSPSLQSNDHVFSVRPELPSSQTSPSTSVGFFDVNNFTENEKQNQNPTNTSFYRSSCELLEDVLEEAEALANVVHPHKRRHLISVPEDHNNSDNNNNNNNNVLLGSFGQCVSSNSRGLKQKEDESLQMNAMEEDLAKLLDWGSDSGEISNGRSSIVTDDNPMIDVQQFLFPNDTTTAAVATTGNQHNRNSTPFSLENLPEIC